MKEEKWKIHEKKKPWEIWTIQWKGLVDISEGKERDKRAGAVTEEIIAIHLQELMKYNKPQIQEEYGSQRE